jgi:NUMOD4 motif
MNEIFKVIDGFERYQIGNWGSVFSTIRATRFLKWTINNQTGYPYVQLMATGASESTRFNIHDLVARAFIPNPDSLPTVNHVNGIKLDAHWENLEWATYSDQQEHALSTGLNMSFGETHYAAVLTWDDVDEIRRLAAQGVFHKDIAARYGCGRKNITKIVNRQRWERRP